MATLTITSGPAQGQSTECDREIVVGREGVDLVIDDDQASRRHTAIRPGPRGVEIEDLGSLNGTFVDGRKISAIATLTSSATLRIGQTNFTLEIAARDLPVADPQRTVARDTPRIDVASDSPLVDVPDRTVVRNRPLAVPEVTTVRPTLPAEPSAPPAPSAPAPSTAAGPPAPPGSPVPPGAPAGGIPPGPRGRRPARGSGHGPPARVRMVLPILALAIVVLVVLLITHVI